MRGTQKDEAVRTTLRGDMEARFQHAHEALNIVGAQRSTYRQGGEPGIIDDHLNAVARIELCDNLSERRIVEFKLTRLPSDDMGNLLR